MEIRKARETDLDAIEQIYDRIHDGEEQGRFTIGWLRGVYPVRKTAEDALGRDDLFVMEDGGKLVSAAIINQIQVPEYKNAVWKHDVPADRILVLHSLVVDPLAGGRGYGRAFVAFYEDYARAHHCPALRMDTNVKNARARRLYQHLGYEEIGVVSCVFNGIPGVQLVCLEKYLG